MLEVTETALAEIKRFLEAQQESQPIRILLTEGDWKGPRLVMALDEHREDDHVLTHSGVTFLVEKTLIERTKPIKIDYVHSTLGAGFTIRSSLLKNTEAADVSCESICRSCADVE